MKCRLLMTFVVLMAGLGRAEMQELIVDPMTTTKHWQLGGHRINYRLGESSVTASKEQLREGADAALRLTYDFSEQRRGYLSAYWTGLPIPGRCEGFSFWLYGDASGRMLRVSLEDASERWHQRRLSPVDWEGWGEIAVPVGEGKGWRALRRRGEAKQPMRHPVRLRQISLLRKPDAPPQGAVYFHELRARADVEPADFVTADITTDRQGNLFYARAPVELKVSLANRGKGEAAGRLSVAVEDFFGARKPLGERQIELTPGKSLETTFTYRADRLGAYTARVSLRSGARERIWFHRFAVSKPGRDLSFDHDSVFGCCAAVRGFRPDQIDVVFRLDRDAGIRWARHSFPWRALEPNPGQFAWAPPETTAGVRGRGLMGGGGSATLAVAPGERLNLRDAITLAFWIRGTGRDGNWQWPVAKAMSTAGRSYGVYLGKETGMACFTGGFEKFPNRGHSDFSSGWSAWDNEWHHFAATYSAKAGKLTLYVDGEVAKTHAVNGGRLRVESEGLRFGHVFPGSLDEAVIYDRVLRPDEIAALAGKQTPRAEGLVGWWSFDDRESPGRDSGPHGLHAARSRPQQEIALRAKKHGIRMLGILGFPPRWASTAPTDAARPWVYKPDLKALARFVEAVTREYRGLVDHWEIWNEPNIRVFWAPEPDPKEFFDVVKVAYAAAKRGNPRCTVITPGLAGAGRQRHGMSFLDELIRLGLPKHCDAISIHPYRQTSPEASDLVGDLVHIADLSAQHGGRRNLWVTEWCWTTQIGGGSTERRSAQMLARAIPLALSTGLMDRIIWFRLHDPGVDRFYTEHNYGLCHNDLTPKPSYFAYRTCSQVLDGAAPGPPIDLGPDVVARRFARGDEHIVALWCPDGERMAALNVNDSAVCVVDIMGNERTARTHDGVLLVKATESAQFVRGLGEGITGRKPPVIIETPRRFVAGQRGTVTVAVCNPFARTETVSVNLSMPDGAPLAAPRVTLGAGQTGTVQVSMRVPTDTPPGRKPVSAEVTMGGTTWTQSAELRFTTVRPDSGPVGVWNLDEGRGTVAHDSSGNNNHGAIATPRWARGRKGTALAFDGGSAADGLVVVPDSPSLDLSEEVTVAFWLKLTGDTGTWQFPVTKFHGNLRRNYGVYIRPGVFSASFSTSLERGSFRHTDVGSSVNLHDSEWHHVAATFSLLDEKVVIYIDGKAAGERNIDAGLMLTNDQPIRIGMGTKGLIDEVIVYGRGLSQAQVSKLAGE